MGGAPPPPLGFAPQGSKKCHFWHFLEGAPQGPPRGPGGAPNPEDPAQGGGGRPPNYPPSRKPSVGRRALAIAEAGHPRALRAEAHLSDPGESGGGAPGPGGAARRPGPGGTPGSRWGRRWFAVVRGRLFCHRPSRAGHYRVPFRSCSRARSGSGSSAALGWSRGDCPPWCRRHETGGLGVPPISSPHPMDDAGTTERGPLSKCGSQTPDTGSGGTPAPDPIRGSGTDARGVPQGGPGGPPRGASRAPAPGGENFRPRGAPREKFRARPKRARDGPGAPDPQNGTFGAYI